MEVKSLFSLAVYLCVMLRVAYTALPQTWVGASSLRMSCVAGSYDGAQLVAGQNPGSLYISTNWGLTWSSLTAPSQAWSSVASSSNGTFLAAVGRVTIGASSLYISTNAGATWSASTNVLSKNWQSVAMSSDGQVLAAVGKSPTGQSFICTSTNSGTAWQSNSLPDLTWASVASSSSGRILIAVGKGAVCMSTNSGNSWVIDNTSITNALTNVASSAAANVLATIGNGQLFVSTNSGASWRLGSAPNAAWSAVASSLDGGQLIATINAGGIWSSYDYGATWISNNAPSAQWIYATSSAGGDRLVAVGNLGIYRCPPNDLSQAQSFSEPFVTPGTTATITLNLQNLGPGDARNVTVSNGLPSGFSFVSASPPPVTNTSSLVFSLGTMLHGSATNINIQATATDAGWWTNTATVRSDTPDIITNNNSSIQ